VVLRELVHAPLGRGGMPQQSAGETALFWALHFGFALLLIFLLQRFVAAQGGWPQMLEMSALAGVVYVVLVYGGSFPWYLISPLTIMSIAPSGKLTRRLLAGTLGLAIGSMLLYAMPATA
jgi:hypothetical protein